MAKDYPGCGEIPSALAQEKQMHFERRKSLGMWGSEMGDLGKGTHPRSPLLS